MIQKLLSNTKMIPINQSISNVYPDFKTREINLQLQNILNIQSKILLEKRVIKHL